MQNNNTINILNIPDNIGYWLIRADGGKYYNDFFLNNFVAVSDNEVNLDTIRKYEKSSISGITIDHYKSIYKEKYPTWTNQQIAHAASRTKKFCNEINIGDLVLVPSHRSTSFLIGLVESDVYEIENNNLESGEDKKVHHAISPYTKRREVHWVKEIERTEVSQKMYWVLSAHQTIFNLKRQKDYINPLLSPLYFQDGMCHGALKISKEEGLNNDEWLKLHSFIKDYTDGSSNNILIKPDVQSPGIIELASENKEMIGALTIVLAGILYGRIDIFGVKLEGIIPYIQSHRMKNENHERELKKSDKQIEILEEERRSKELDNKKKELDIQKDKHKSLDKKAQDIHAELEISSFNVGKIVEDQKQVDTSNDPDEDKS